jgi:hypothetical protein
MSFSGHGKALTATLLRGITSLLIGFLPSDVGRVPGASFFCHD